MNIAGTSRGSSLRNPLRRGGLKHGFDNDRLESKANNLELNFYATPPNYELSIDEFETLALARLKVSGFHNSLIYGLNVSSAYP